MWQPVWLKLVEEEKEQEEQQQNQQEVDPEKEKLREEIRKMKTESHFREVKNDSINK